MATPAKKVPGFIKILNHNINVLEFKMHVNRRLVMTAEEAEFISPKATDNILPMWCDVDFEDIDRIVLFEKIRKHKNDRFTVDRETYYKCTFTMDILIAPHNFDAFMSTLGNHREFMANMLANISDRWREDAESQGEDDRPSLVLDFVHDQLLDKNSFVKITVHDHT